MSDQKRMEKEEKVNKKFGIEPGMLERNGKKINNIANNYEQKRVNWETNKQIMTTR